MPSIVRCTLLYVPPRHKKTVNDTMAQYFLATYSFYFMFIEWSNFNFIDVDIFFIYYSRTYIKSFLNLRLLNQIFNLISQILMCGNAWVSLISSWNIHHPLCHEELMTQHFIDICFTVICDANFHSACFNGCVFSWFWPGGCTEDFQVCMGSDNVHCLVDNHKIPLTRFILISEMLKCEQSIS